MGFDAARPTPADFQHGLQLGLRVGSQDIVLPSRGDVPRDHCLLHVVNVDTPRTQLQGRLDVRPRRLLSGRRRVVETRLRIAELHDIVVVQLDPPLQCLAVDQRAISTACVLDQEIFPSDVNNCVPPRNARFRDADRAVRAASYDVLSLAQLKRLRLSLYGHDECSHVSHH